MSGKQHYTIPIFIPEKACPYRCIYCNQYAIANQNTLPSLTEVKDKIETYLSTFPENAKKKIGFFGGSFTGMSIEEQNLYLDPAYSYIKQGKIAAIQLSTRPDYITEDILENLKKHGVETIELGAQSLDDEVLKLSRRGHTATDVRKSAKMILDHGFRLGLQMMAGLPGDTFEKTMNTAREIVELGAHCTRIYPTLVIRGTKLEELYQAGEYEPLSMDEAVQWSKELMKWFNANDVTILRVGLHPSEGLLTGKDLVAGPFHVSFKELVLSACWKELLQEKIDNKQGNTLTVSVPPEQINAAIGYEASNKKWLQQSFKMVFFKADENLSALNFRIIVE